MVRLLAVDFDGTIAGSDLEIAGGIRRVLKRVKEERGARVVIATSRPFRTVWPRVDHSVMDPLYVCYNGALVFDSEKRAVLRRVCIPSSLAGLVYACIKRRLPSSNVTVEVDDRWYIEDYEPGIKSYVEQYALIPPEPLPLTESLLSDISPCKMFFAGGPGTDLRALEEELKHLVQGRTRIVLDGRFLEVCPPTDKSEGVKFVAQYYGIPMNQVMAIGDGPNDIEMIRASGVGVWIINEPESEVKADHTVQQTDLAAFLEGYFGLL